MNMKRFRKILLIVASLFMFTNVAYAQYYQLANQLGEMIKPALSGSFNYKGHVDVAYLHGFGPSGKKVDIISATTTQGFNYASWLFMGVGAGVDFALTPKDRFVNNSEVGVILPLFTEFRFKIGNQNKTSMFIGLRLGASFLVSDIYMGTGNGYITSEECFYLKPSVGVRIPINKKKPKQAVNISASYQLMTPGCSYYDSLTLNNFGATIGFEW